ncbi:hypothetical protein ACJX0J_032309, partial [Zea mays]
ETNEFAVLRDDICDAKRIFIGALNYMQSSSHIDESLPLGNKGIHVLRYACLEVVDLFRLETLIKSKHNCINFTELSHALLEKLAIKSQLQTLVTGEHGKHLSQGQRDANHHMPLMGLLAVILRRGIVHKLNVIAIYLDNVNKFLASKEYWQYLVNLGYNLVFVATIGMLILMIYIY